MSEPVTDFLRRAGAGSTKLAAKYLASGVKETPEIVPDVVALLKHEKPAVRAGAARALAILAETQAALVAPHAEGILWGTHAEETETREATLEALAWIAPLNPAPLAAHVQDIAAALKETRKPALREQAAKCLGNCGAGDPARAHAASEPLLQAISKNPRDKQARQILAAMHQIAKGPVNNEDRQRMAAAVNPLRGHPDIQVRERAGQLYKILQAGMPGNP